MKLKIENIFFVLVAIPYLGLAQVHEDQAKGEVISYKEGIGERGQMEIHFPKGHKGSGKKVPGIILFHGGGWKGGNSGQFRDLCRHFASRGLVAASAHYRFTESHPQGIKGSPKRICIMDAKSAIRWFKKNADSLGVDPQNIVSGGGSAGAHVAMLATLTPDLNDPEDPKDVDTSVVAYLLFNPAFSPGDKVDSEVYIEQQLKQNVAPMIAFWGTNDTWLEGWYSAHNKMKTLGLKVEWWSAAEQGHSFFNKDPWKSLTIAEADRFLVKQGLLGGQAQIPSQQGGEKLKQVLK
jgi:acetyl esterase